jgi:hypothetical protein
MVWREGPEIGIESRDYWVKVASFLQQNWALLEERHDGVVVWFISDTSGVFDQLHFRTRGSAERALRWNKFTRIAESSLWAEDCAPQPPRPPFREVEHPSGMVFSSGRYWVGWGERRTYEEQVRRT